MKLQKTRNSRRRGPTMWPICPVSQAEAMKKLRATPMLDVMNISPFISGRTMASMRNTVLPVWFEAKQWKSGKETASDHRVRYCCCPCLLHRGWPYLASQYRASRG